MYIYGGHDIREGSLDNLWMIDMNNFNDLDMQPEDQEKSCEWKLLEPKGNVHPGAISHHTSIVYSDKMYLFGGSKASGQENKHFYSFNIDKLQWTIIKAVSYFFNYFNFSKVERTA